MDIVSDSNSDDSEVFIIKQIKPVIPKSSKLVQLTLEGTSAVKGSINSACYKTNQKNKKRNREKKLNSASNKIKSKKIKNDVSRKVSPKKVLPITRLNKEYRSNNTQPTSSGEIILEETKKCSVKNVQTQIHSYFSRNKEDEENKGILQLDSSSKVINEQEIQKNIKFDSHELPVVPNSSVNDINELLTSKGIINPNFKYNTVEEKQCAAEKNSETSDINVIQISDFGEYFNSKDNSYVEELPSFEEFQNNFLHDESKFSDEEKSIDHSELLCSHFKKIIHDEIEKQAFLEKQSLKNGNIIEKLISEPDLNAIKKFFNLNENACKVFIRMLGRKKGWHRVCAINYPGISNNLNIEFSLLHKEGFMDVNIEDENLNSQMELLNKSEVVELCKAFNVSIKSSKTNSCRKETLISLLISNSEKQISALDMFKLKSSTTRLNMLKSKVKNCLGLCVKVNDGIYQVFYKFLLLFSFAHYQDEESKRFNNEVYMWLQVLKNFIRFPSYKLSPTVVFETLADFEEYKNSLLIQDTFETAITSKDYDGFTSAYNLAKIEFKKLLENIEYHKRFLNLKPFLRKFSAGTVYAKILTKYCKTFKKQSSSIEISSTAQLLLDQNLFLSGKKGEWYEILSKALENQKQSNAAAELLIKALKDPVLNEVQKLTLQLRGQSILRKKASGISDVQVRDILGGLCTLSVQEPTYVEIKGKALEGNEAGFKCVYVQELENGKLYASVEERAISYYKSIGYTKGYHSEGIIIHTIYFLLFFDIIYGLSPQGVFQSPYQKAPLDFNSRSFYHDRKEEIESLLNDMLNWDDEQIEAKIKNSYYENYNITSVITWNDKFTPELFCEIIKCITMPVLVLIFRRLVTNYRTFRSGFPDLTLWDPDTSKCKFVEVKSPNDKLSPAQRIWLDYLKNIGLDCEVCNVKNISSKSFG